MPLATNVSGAIALYASLIALVVAYSVPTFGVLLSSFKNKPRNRP